MNKQISNVITQLRVISTIVIVVYHAACPYGGWEAFTATISNNISSMNIINLIFQKLLCNDMLPIKTPCWYFGKNLTVLLYLLH